MSSDPSSRSDAAVTVVLVLVHGALWAALAFFLLFVVPGYEKLFRDFGLKLPGLVEAVIALSHLLSQSWYLLPIPIGLGLALDGAILFWLRREESSRMLSWSWFVFWLIVPLAALVVFWLALVWSQAKLHEGLAK